MSGLQPIRVLLVDDEPVFVAALRMFLERDARMLVIGAAGDGGEAVELALRHDADVVVMDLGLPRMDGLEATRRLRTAQPRTAVIILTGRTGDELETDARSAGAAAFLTKGGVATDDTLIEQIVALAPVA